MSGKKGYLVVVVIFMTFIHVLLVARAEADTTNTPVLQVKIEERNFYAFAALDQNTELSYALAQDAVLHKILAGKLGAIKQANQTCLKLISCYSKAFHWSDMEIRAVDKELRALYRTNPRMKTYVDISLRKTRRYELYRAMDGVDFLSAVWIAAAHGMNNIIDVYANGKKPRYPLIDSSRYDSMDTEYQAAIQALSMMVTAEAGSNTHFYFPTLKFALSLLSINDREDAGRYDPLTQGENAPALAHSKSVDWKRYPYSVILVPGEGPDLPGVELSPLGRIRCEMAAWRYHQGKAPFILLSGGTVHPAFTPYNEAVEMKKVLVQQYGISVDTILIDPYARHTTTNLRNAVREIDRYNFPMNKPLLVLTDIKQSAMIESSAFDARCLKELHYKPYLSLRRTSDVDLEMMPNPESLQEDATDPMDP